MTKAEKELIEEKFTGIHALIQANYDVNNIQHNALMEKLEAVHCQALKTNGRVTNLENETKFFRYLQRNPKASVIIGILLVLGSISAISIIGYKTIIEKIITNI